jgi:hypothetical protein
VDVRVCDRCEGKAEVVGSVTFQEEDMTFDLCEEHKQELISFLAGSPDGTWVFRRKKKNLPKGK